MDATADLYGGLVRSVAVVIPTFNRLTAVRAAIDSVQNQTYPARQIIVVDDGSTDGSAAALRTIPGIHLIEQPNRGPGAARDAGARAASADLIAFLDDDDTWRTNKLEVQVPMFDDDSVGLVHSAGHLFDPRSGWEAVGYYGDHIDFHDILNYKVPGIQTAVVRRSVFEDVGGFDTTLRGPEDWDFFLRVAAKHRILGTPEVLVDVDAVPGLGGNVKTMYSGQMRVLKRAALVHVKCAECSQIVAHTERVIRMYGVETEKARARRLRDDNRRVRAVLVRVGSYRYDPQAVLRLPYRIARRLTRRT